MSAVRTGVLCTKHTRGGQRTCGHLTWKREKILPSGCSLVWHCCSRSRLTSRAPHLRVLNDVFLRQFKEIISCDWTQDPSLWLLGTQSKYGPQGGDRGAEGRMNQVLGCCKSVSCNSCCAALENLGKIPPPGLPHSENAKLKSEFKVYFSFIIESGFKVSGLLQNP